MKEHIRIIEEMDAALFSGDTFYSPEAITDLRAHIPRWQRQIDEIEEFLNNKYQLPPL